MDQARDPLIDRLIEGRYHLDALIAHGGMATVYEATDIRLERKVAVKVMNRSLAEDAGFVQRFQREAKAAARLSDPNVVGVYDQGQYDGLVFLVMEYVPGQNLREVLTANGALPPQRALGVLDQVLWALSAAHAAGFVHRDIKPENVLIQPDGTAKVADFGLARAIVADTVSSRTQGVIIGTVGYLAPEQVEQGTADERSDVYSAGVLLYEMLTGRLPFDAPTPLAVAYRHVNDRVPPPSQEQPGLAPELDDLVLTATARAPEDRYPTSEAFVAAVQRVQDVVGVAETAPSPVVVPAVTGPIAAPESATTALTGETGTAVLPLSPDLAHMDDATAIVGAGVVDRSGPASDDELPADTGHQTSPDRPAHRSWGRFSRRGPRIALVAVVLVLAAALGGFAWYAGSLRYIVTPDLVGMTVPQAQQALAAAYPESPDLHVEQRADAFSEEVAKGVILSTDPAAGVRARERSTIAATVSKGPERYEVPQVRGQSIEAATKAITEAKLTVSGSTSAFDDTVPSGQVASTDPAAGTPLKPGAAVGLLVSKGPAPVAVPPVENQPKDQATATLQAAGLTVTPTEQFSDTVAAGNAIGTAPAAGTQVKRGDPVTLLVSKGPPPVTVPTVTDLKSADAAAKLQAAGFKVAQKALTGFVALDRVVSQDPAGGSSAPKGSTVTITLV